MAKDKQPFYEFKAAAQGDEVTELLLYGDIADDSWWSDANAQDFAKTLKGVTSKTLNIHINSYGGSVFAGSAMYSALKNHSAFKNVYIDGIAASAASLIAMAGDKVIMPANAMLMIHNPWTYAAGDHRDFEKQADTLKKIREAMATAYMAKTGMSKDEVIALLDAETWLTAEEAVSMKFADEVTGALQVAASVKDGKVFFGSVGIDIDKMPQKHLANIALNSQEFQPKPKNQNERSTKKMTRAEMEAQHPEIVAEIRAAAIADADARVQAAYEQGTTDERARMAAIDDIAPAGVEALVKAAKYDNPISAETLAVNIVKAHKEKGSTMLASIKADAEGLNTIENPEPANENQDEKDLEAHKNSFKNAAKNIKR